MSQPDPISFEITMVRLTLCHGLSTRDGIWELATKTPVPKDRAKIRGPIQLTTVAKHTVTASRYPIQVRRKEAMPGVLRPAVLSIFSC